ncbi:MAG: hypothetical protein JO302_02285 [Candidatus Eremiobacteraeota bacterium]|nr:hypothetical protein [Candidatus Eremiobacteraeota bacterium]
MNPSGLEGERRGPRGELGAFAAHDDAMGLPMVDVVQRLVDYLGATTVAAIGGVNETRAVRQWMTDGGREPQRPHVLRFALQLASMIANHADEGVVRAWFQGCNPHLDDEVPALLLRNRPLDEVRGAMIAAARSFAGRA